MNLSILSCAPKCYSTLRLIEAAKQRGHKVKVLDTTRLSLELAHGEPDLYYKGAPIDTPDAILPRIGTSLTRYGTAVVRQFEQMDVYTPNTSAGISNSRDKLRSLQILSRHDVGIPLTGYVNDKRDVSDALERVGGAPVIIKLLEGTQGVGVILADKPEIAKAIIETLHSTDQQVLLQKFVAESKGKDVRAFVIGDRVVAAIRRTAQGQEFRSNVHRGGKAEAIDLDPAYAEAAVRAAQIMGLHVCGVDMLEGAKGPQIMEVNSSPGFEGIEGATGLDIAGAVVDYIADQVKFPDIDIRQRLTVSRGYGVADILIPEGSSLVGKTIEETGLREQDVVVLTLRRGSSVISNPKGSRVLEADDSLLCYGRSAHMKGLIPDQPKKRRKLKPLPTTSVTEGNTI
ncbi:MULTISPECIES: RimK family alpha-L-glutamate ligase [unclassified Lentimonas]|uniref:RimK family alpha-L-glutamate ligase n=1 Tax=unclassified Lentimonas TaxID=2630993 RepID=UPI00132A86FF|nr:MULTISPECIES: RimK family alpha-L-glutamate ligase [unclassified Lentimonas]CAA6691797.1 Ribosomal protein S6 glutaminyl transferase [Lentimonas sp. CC19]CAA6694544.1 Ribosomal protein S6 glutaminyl transferase [Lentimonas sp. CC10]CAA7072086.1 Ribosomal protein S6 glutaminyl transferase [Lentimonas sp. CC11]